MHRFRHSPSEILEYIKKIDNAPNKTLTIKKLGITGRTYYNWKEKLKQHGIEYFENNYSTFSKVSKSELKKILIKTESIEKTAKVFGVTRSEVDYRMSKFNLLILKLLKNKKKDIEGKICPICNIYKSRENFYPVDSIDGMHTYCKNCLLKNQKEIHERNPSAKKQSAKKYRERMKLENPKIQQDAADKYRASARGIYTKIKQRVAKRKTNRLNMSYEEFESWFIVQPTKCYYCGLSQKQYALIRKNIVVGGISRIKAFSIDRKKNEDGYSIENISLCCPLCNYLKGWIFTENEFKEIAFQYVTPYNEKLLDEIQHE